MDDRTTTNFTKTKPVDRPATFNTSAPKKSSGLALLVVVVLGAGAAGWYFYVQQRAPQPTRPNQGAVVMPVVAAPAVTGDIEITINGLGTVTSLATVTIRSQISGYLTRVAYTEGQAVRKGDLLAEIDSRSYELALQNTEGALARDQAMLQSSELDLKRYQELSKTNAIPRQQLDQQTALVGQNRGNVLSDQAQIETQKLNIAYCHIVAPITGRAGLRLVDPGNYVTAGDATGVVVLTQLQPISVIFTVAEDNVPQIAKRLRAGASLPVTAFDRGGVVKLATGELKTLDNQIDTTTGTLKLRAVFANEDEGLFPNQFVNVQLLVDVLHDATVVPTSAIQRGAPGTFVYLVNADNTVAVKPVTLGPANGERVAIQSGLSPGDRVVIDGADKLRNGARVVPRNPNPGAAGAAPAAAMPAAGAAGAAAGAPAGDTTSAPGGGGGRRPRGSP